MDYWRREKVGATTGIVAALVMAAAAFVAGAYPDPDADAQTIRSFLVDNRSGLLVQIFLFGIGAAFGLWFLGSLRSALRRAEGGAGRLTSVAFGGGIAALGGVIVGLLLTAGLAQRIAEEADLQLTATLFHLGNLTAALTSFPLIVLVGATSIVAARTGLFPRWLVLIGVAAIAFEFLGTVSIFVRDGAMAPGGALAFYGPFAGTLIWVVFVSATLAARLGAPVDGRIARRRTNDLWLIPGGVDRRSGNHPAGGKRAEDRVER